MELTRRDVLKLGVAGSAALYLPVERFAFADGGARLARLPRPFTQTFSKGDVLDLRGPAPGGQVSATLTMEPVQRQILGPAPDWPSTELWTYVWRNPSDKNDVRINPTIHVDRGVKAFITQINALPPTHPQLGYESWTSVHLHGSPSKPQFDGYASDVIKPGPAGQLGQRKT